MGARLDDSVSGQPTGKETANVYLVNYTHVFSPTSTNEFVFSYAKFVNDNSLANPRKGQPHEARASRRESLYGSAGSDQIREFRRRLADGDDLDSGVRLQQRHLRQEHLRQDLEGARHQRHLHQDCRTHSFKAGFYWDAEENLQSNGSDVNGTYTVANWGASSTYNETLDRLLARNQNYSQTNIDTVPDIIWHQWSIWGQDRGRLPAN